MLLKKKTLQLSYFSEVHHREKVQKHKDIWTKEALLGSPFFSSALEAFPGDARPISVVSRIRP